MPLLLDTIKRPRDIRKLKLSELPLLAEEVRREIIEVVSHRGGHLGSNLGVVDLTIALHYVFDIENDVVTWDVSNQTYTHKILTGRRERFPTLRQQHGISGFANREESPYDPFTFGHAGTAISTAVGIVSGDELTGRNRKVIAVVGDGAMTCGVSYEALNNCGASKKNILVILNDNTMSISRTVGAMSNYLNDLRTAPLYNELKSEIHEMLNKLPVVGHPIEEGLETIRRSLKATVGNNLFSALGFHYYGPINGHDLPLLVRTLRNLKRQKKPILLHLITQKGKGHPDAGSDPHALHGVTPRRAETKIEVKTLPAKKPYTKVFAESLIRLAERDNRIVAVTAAMPEGTGLIEFEKRFPSRFFDVGICEQHAVGLAAGLAHVGLRPVAAIYSTFLQRAYDQVFQELCLQKLPVVIAMDRAGIVGADGATHNGLFDIAYLRTFPNIVLTAPRDAEELDAMLAFALTLDVPTAIRYPRTDIPDFSSLQIARTPIRLGKAEVLTTGADGAILAYGSMVETALAASAALSREGIDLCVVNARFVKPLDTGIVRELLTEQPFLLLMEEHSSAGGFCSAVMEAAVQLGLDTRKMKPLALADKFLEHGDRKNLLQAQGLDPESVVALVKTLAVAKPRARRTNIRV
ncbi:MAG: 1-deoxy-D-xylulose-5-phosphate synthase [Planctomycetes bacterium RBG_16_59_8]|nr:MAG: 1-deoxy-D-xylulose-5-phosphate synthase [Planctomycetes bacterium RBG_16_59_8]